MKYRIEVVRRKNGQTVYYPQVKEGWWDSWENIRTFYDDSFSSEEEARTVIKSHKDKREFKKTLVAESVSYIKV